MPELKIDEKPTDPLATKPTETKPVVTVAVAIAALIAGWGGGEIADTKAIDAKMAKATVETVSDKLIPARKIAVWDSIVADTSKGTVDTIGKKLVDAPARVEPIFKKHQCGVVDSGETYILTLTKKDNDSLMIYTVFNPQQTGDAVLKFQVVPKGE